MPASQSAVRRMLQILADYLEDPAERLALCKDLLTIRGNKSVKTTLEMLYKEALKDYQERK